MIVEEVSKRINHTLLHVAKYPVGLKSRVKDVISLLDLGCNKEIIMVGIHGIGGIGKTTITCAVHNVIVDQFEGVCFLSDVRERSNKHGLVELQETLLSELTGEKEIKVGNVRKGIPILKRRLCQKKVLLILDDVNSREQLEAIAGGVDWFGFGSRIIITTRDKHLLDIHGVSRHYEAKELYFKDALELLSWNAFKNNKVDSRYLSISRQVTNYCNGLPLALEIIGSNLFNKTQEEWKSALDIYENIPDKNIQDVLKISYNDLEKIEKEIFLDIACFFKGYHFRDVKNIFLNGRGYNPEYGIGVLEKKSLIGVDEGQRVKMHDLMAQMGREIIRSQSPSTPENWSRLWNYKDILCVLEEDKGTDKIEALVLSMPRDKKVLWDGKAFKKMKNLKILIVDGACFSCETEHLPNSLRILDWRNYSSSTLPNDFHPRNLTLLNLRHSSLRLIKPLKNFESLTQLVLRHCRLLEQVPDVSGAVNLRELDISCCKNLIEVHDSVGSLDKLVSLNAFLCSNLRVLPHSIKSASLELLDLSYCISLQSVPQIFRVIQNSTLGSVRDSFPFECTLELLPADKNSKVRFQRSNGDKTTVPISLRVGGLTSLSQYSYSDNIINKYLSALRPYYCSLTVLRLPFSDLEDEFLYQQLPWFPHLNYLDVTDNKFTIIPESMNECLSLETLILDGCEEIREIKGIPPNIKCLSAIKCMSLTSESSNKLLSQAFNKKGGRFITVPGFRIPHWVDHRCTGSSISFWCRNQFPRLTLCFVHSTSFIKFDIFINDSYVITVTESTKWIDDSVTCVCALDVHEWGNTGRETLFKNNEWNCVRISLYTKDIYWVGVHVYKEEIGTDYVRFEDPHPLKKKFIIDGNSKLSLKKGFCSFLNMEVCDTRDSKEKTKRSYPFLIGNKSCSSSQPEDSIEGAIWTMEAPTKVKVLLLKMLDESLPTYHNLFIRELVNSPICPICETEIENIEHVFLYCPWTQLLWFECSLSWTYLPLREDIMDYWFEQNFLSIKSLPNAEKVTGLIGNICWAIWKTRNEFVLSDKPVHPQEALMTARAMQFSPNFSVQEMERTYTGLAFEVFWTGATHPGDRKNKDIVDNVEEEHHDEFIEALKVVETLGPDSPVINRFYRAIHKNRRGLH